MQNSTHGPQTPTPRWQLWTIGIVGGLIATFVIGAMGDGDVNATRQSATQFGAWSIRLLVVGALVAGGWSALRKGRG